MVSVKRLCPRHCWKWFEQEWGNQQELLKSLGTRNKRKPRPPRPDEVMGELRLRQLSMGCVLEEGPSSKQVPRDCQTYDARQEGEGASSSLFLPSGILPMPPLAKLKPNSARKRAQVIQSAVAPGHKTVKSRSTVDWDRKRLQNRHQRLDSSLSTLGCWKGA